MEGYLGRRTGRRPDGRCAERGRPDRQNAFGIRGGTHANRRTLAKWPPADPIHRAKKEARSVTGARLFLFPSNDSCGYEPVNSGGYKPMPLAMQRGNGVLPQLQAD
ncbi:protein of unknown function [Pararobbsia alpina]